MIPIKTKEEIEIMKEGGKITAEARQAVLAAIEPGVKTKVLNRLAEKMISKKGGEPSFKTIRGYRFASCININEGVVHGLPGNRKIQEGDLVTVDLGTLYKGLHTDSGWTKKVQSSRLRSRNSTSVYSAVLRSGCFGGQAKFKVQNCKFLKVGKEALEGAIGQCRVGNYLGDVSNAIQETIEGAGYSVVRNYIGHGVGRELHEKPEIPGIGKKGSGSKLLEGMALAIEVIYAEGDAETKTLEDGWTVVTVDRSNAALFEHTVALTKGGPIVLTE